MSPQSVPVTLKLDFLRFFPAVLHYSSLRLRKWDEDIQCISALYPHGLKQPLRWLSVTTHIDIDYFNYPATLSLISGNELSPSNSHLFIRRSDAIGCKSEPSGI